MTRNKSVSPQAHTAQIVRPAAGVTSTVAVTQDSMNLGFEVSPIPSNVAKEGLDLVFTFDDGGTVILQGYYKYF